MKNGDTLTNAEFSTQDKIFQEACRLAGVAPVKRQASKYRRGTGSAYKFKGAAAKAQEKQN
jgi:hypothetical protein